MGQLAKGPLEGIDEARLSELRGILKPGPAHAVEVEDKSYDCVARSHLVVVRNPPQKVVPGYDRGAPWLIRVAEQDGKFGGNDELLNNPGASLIALTNQGAEEWHDIAVPVRRTGS